MRRNQKGFTLMELMVVIVIVAILAAVAVPLYINYVKDAQRTEAKGAIGAVITAEQTYYQTNPIGYTDQLSDLNVDLTDVAQWIITLSNPSVTGFTARAESSTLGLWVECDYTRGGVPVWREGNL